MAHFEMKAVRHLSVSDVLEFTNEVRLFTVTRIEIPKYSGRQKLHLRSRDGTRLTLLREPNDELRVAAER